MSSIWKSCCVTALCLGAAGASAEDLTIVSKIVENDKEPVMATSYIASDRMRIAAAGGSEVLSEPAAGKFTMIDHKRKEYFVVTTKDMEAAAAQMQENMKKAEAEAQKSQEQMKNMPPAIREKMAGLMGGMIGQIDVKKGPGTKTIAGYRCEEWTLSLGQMSTTDQCLTMDLPLPPQSWEAYKAFSEKMTAAMAAGPMASAMSQMQEKTKDMKGYPLASVTTTKVLGRTSSSSTEVTEIKKGPIPASAWAIPAGYKLTESPFAKMTQKR